MNRISKQQTTLDQLTEDLREAAALSSIVESSVLDNGASNFDAIELQLPRIPKQLVLDAIRAAGLRGSVEGKWFRVYPPTQKQGEARTALARAMSGRLRAKGYRAGVVYVLD